MRGDGANPFDYQRPLRDALIDRQRELDELQRAAADRVAVNLVSPRRFGKTSLLRAHLATMRAAGHRACFVDLDRVTTVADVADRLVDGVRALPADPDRHLERRMGRLGLTISATGLSVSVAPRRPARPLTADEARAAIRDLLGLFGELGTPGELTVVAMDEFQDLLIADDRLDGVFRSVIQHQEDVAYVFAGSSPSLMQALFAHRERPFYGQARPIHLPRLPEDETLAYVSERLPAVAGAAPAAAAVVALADGHPQRTMLLAHHLWDLLDRDPALGDDAAAMAVDAALRELDDAFATQWGHLDRAERLAVAALADGRSPTSRATAADSRVARSTLQRAVERIRGDEQLADRAGGGLRLLDPLFAEWLRRAGSPAS